MRTSKRLLSVLLALTMVVAMVSVTALADEAAAPALPTATVTEIENEDLTFALNFKADEVTEEQLAYYGDWAADFVMTISDAATFNANGQADGYLAGSYAAYENGAWVKVPFTNVEVGANEEFAIMQYAASLMGNNTTLTYKDVVNTVKDFSCGVFFDEEYLEAHPDLTVTLELQLSNGDESHVIGSSYKFVAEVPALPTATVTEIENEDLTFALNFKADEVTGEQLAYYGDWAADFVMTISKAATFNANGEADGYLAGSYAAYEEGAWVKVPFEDVAVGANEEFAIMQYAASLMGNNTTLTYKDVVNTVKDFSCGVFFDEEYLEANPDLTVTLELRLCNPENSAQDYVIGETHTFSTETAEPAPTPPSGGTHVPGSPIRPAVKPQVQISKPIIFEDVHAVSHWAESSIDFVTARGLFNGTTATTFSPDALTTRGQLMTVLARLDGVKLNGDPIEAGKIWAMHNGISDGTNAGKNITRQDVAVMLWRYAGEPAGDEKALEKFTDAHNIAEYAEEAVAWAVEVGILTGYPDSTLQPTANATRAHVAAMVERFVKYVA